MLLKARPRRPSPAPEANEEETLLASSITWPVTLVEPTETSSVPQTPLAPEPSAYEISHVDPDWPLYVDDLEESYTLWFEVSLEGRRVEKTHLWILLALNTINLSRYSQNSQVSTSRIEVQVKLLATDSNRNKVLGVAGVGRCWGGTVLALAGNTKFVPEGSGEVLGGSEVELPVGLQHGGSSIAVGSVDGREAEGSGRDLLRGGSRLGGQGQGEKSVDREHLVKFCV
jgi:hypothetical protein